MPAANDPVLDQGLFDLLDELKERLGRLERSSAEKDRTILDLQQRIETLEAQLP
jgi:uncharacterized coiled-coil protein SlyX